MVSNSQTVFLYFRFPITPPQSAKATVPTAFTVGCHPTLSIHPSCHYALGIPKPVPFPSLILTQICLVSNDRFWIKGT